MLKPNQSPPLNLLLVIQFLIKKNAVNCRLISSVYPQMAVASAIEKKMWRSHQLIAKTGVIMSWLYHTTFVAQWCSGKHTPL